MAQYTYANIVPGTETGTALATRIDAMWPAIVTQHSGISAPGSPQVGQFWLDTSGGSTAYVLKTYDGATWVELFDLDFTNSVAKANTGLDLLASVVRDATTSATPMTLTTSAAANYQRTVLELVGVGAVTAGSSLWLEVSQASSWQTVTAGLVAQNTVIGTAAPITTAPVTSAKLLINDAKGGWVSGRFESVENTIITVLGNLSLLTTSSGGAPGTTQLSYGYATGSGPIDGYRISCSVAFMGNAYLWGMPQT